MATPFNIKEQLNMINTFQPEITSLGVIYLATDTRSQSYLKALEKKCKDNGVYLEKQRALDIPEFIYMIENRIGVLICGVPQVQ